MNSNEVVAFILVKRYTIYMRKIAMQYVIEWYYDYDKEIFIIRLND